MMITILQEGIASLGLSLTQSVQLRLIDYLDLIEKWNKVHNLTSIRDKKSMIYYHLLDSLSALSYLQGPYCLDVGSGAGLPGIPLALALPDCHFYLIESNTKKVAFLKHVVMKLSLSQVKIIHSRCEDFQFLELFNTIIFRALGSLSQVTTWTEHLLAKQGFWLAMKGHRPEKEIEEVSQEKPLKIDVIPIVIPKLQAKRCLIKMKLASD